ncbi:SMC family ATPase, partial [Streptomyces sp. NPDC007084]|uniref:SMC family ATPase n=1 Tax=Streptomyces sp. NPDC007084 TaxID=3154313 RepID=UPI00345616A0
MRLHRLDITAFGPFGGTQRVDFDELSAAGLFLLHGPTGAGKTSVLDAVCYALYGAVPGARQSGQGLGLRSDHAAPATRTEVRLELTVSGRRLEVTRQPPWARPKKRGSGTTTEKAQSWLRAYDSAAGVWTDLSRSHQEIGEEITQLLGMSREQFCQVVLLPQGDFARFLRADAEARGKLLGRLFDTQRFAEVEKRLAERRRATEAEVRTGDAALLADAHRMHQEAGDTAEEPFPEPAPGDPGLAEAVLAWAAVARSTARERLTIAHCARRAAEAAQAAADRELDDVRELDRLQRRFTEARERAARLEERADAHLEARARMERARKAETVAPALDLREAAEAEHRRAAAAEARARADLPDTFAGAGAPGLAAAARKAAEELGGLEAGRRAERRLAELAVERDALDRQERADEDVLQEAVSWLADWETLRTGIEARIESAQEAAARAEQLGVQRDPAIKRLRAARQRDQFARDTEDAHARAIAAREAAAEARTRWLDLKEQRLQGIAAELAAQLVDGEACAVCGATEHPAPARKITGHVDRETEERALAAYQQADDQRATAERLLGGVREALAAASAEAGDAPTSQLAQEVEELERLLGRAREAASGLHAAREAREQAEREHLRRLTSQQDAAGRVASRASHRDALDREKASLEGQLEQARGAAASVAARAGQLEGRAALLSTAAERARASEDTARRLKDADARLADAAFRAGFDTPQAAADALLDDEAHRDLQRSLDAWQLEESTVRAVLAEPDTADAARRPPADVPAAERAAEAAGRR